MAKRRHSIEDPEQLSLFANDAVKPQPVEARPDPFLAEVLRRTQQPRRQFYSRREYYDSMEWAAKRRQKKEEVGYVCERCGKGGHLDVHHRNYNSLYDERMEDLMVVCRSCHNVADGAREYDSAYSTWLDKRYGEDAYMHADCEREIYEFDDWLERQRY